jgi:hypothetical protein
MPEYFLDKQHALKIGDARVQKIAASYRKLGYFVITNPSNHEGADIIIIALPDGRVRKVIECTNYKKPEYYIGPDRLDRYIKTLTAFKGIEGVELELVVSFMENLSFNQYNELKTNGINVKVEGPQDLPEQYAAVQREPMGWIN